ncbi:MAG: NAD(P)/FAD-dependent oxidoreductase [Promethearchaeota archaeon]|nr:MAG: NAD(P)/FAD-dependent oxidoreductase [Candidatus Lokiarchaeota archaeon]
MYDIIVIGAGISGASFAYKISKFAKILLIEAQDYESQIPVRTNIYAEHNKPFIEPQFWNDREIFPRDFLQLNYKSEKHDGLLDSKEFGAPLGKICHTEIFLDKLIRNFNNNGGETRFNESVSKINHHQDHVEVVTHKGEEIKTKVLVLATGSRGFELQKSLGFRTPDSYKGIYLNTWADEDLLNQNFSFQYMFHLNPNISINGPFFFNVGNGRLSTGYLGNLESPAELKDKLERILYNYKKIQSFVKGLSWDLTTVVVGDISKHPIKKMSKDRVLILGEAAGLVTSFFYEGMLCGLASADTASKILKPLLNNGNSFSESQLINYDREISKLLLEKYFRNGNACEYLFYETNASTSKTIWNAYTDMLLKNKTVRQFVYDVLLIQDLTKYNTDNDRWVGEKLFGNLPIINKATLWPRFLKAMSF